MLALAVVPAFGQPTFSIDYQSGLTIGVPDGFTGTPINEGDIVVTVGGFPVPGPFPVPPPANVGIVTFAGGPSLGVDLGLPAFLPPPYVPGLANLLEVDALSYGLDFPIDLLLPPHEAIFTFSVDEHAVGLPLAFGPPDVTSEGMFGVGDTAADIYVTYPPGALPPFPAPPFAAGIGNTLIFDGDGVDIGATGPGPLPVPLPPFTFFGLGLGEGPATPYAVPDIGDNLDALDVDTPTPLASFPIYFSLDAGFPDPIEVLAPAGVPPPNSASAFFQGLGFVGGDVLVTAAPAGPPAIYATAAALGLDIFGVDTDDVDALVLWENGIAGYQQSAIDFDWIGGASDMLLFSVRRGSAIIGSGLFDFRFGFPIEEGDILTPPPAGSPPGTPPGIWMAAENLGLATIRSNVPLTPLTPLFPLGLPGVDDDANGITDDEFIADELDALDVAQDCDASGLPDVYDFLYGIALDCNSNGISDICDITSGFSMDCDGNGIPDTCTIEADTDCDVDVDGIDFTVFSSCYNKSGRPPRTLGCPPAWQTGFDYDGDGDIDGVDFTTFAACFNKSGNPPRSPCNIP